MLVKDLMKSLEKGDRTREMLVEKRIQFTGSDTRSGNRLTINEFNAKMQGLWVPKMQEFMDIRKSVWRHLYE